MAYTDKEMQLAAMLSYIEIDPVKDKDKSLQEIIKSHPEYIKELEASVSAIKRSDKVDKMTLDEYQYRLDLLKDIKNGKSECADWIVRKPVDHSETTGFAACVYETQPGKAIIAFRGSNQGDFETNGEDNPGQFKHDWIENDFGLHNCAETPQQAEAKRYMEMLNREYGDQYRYGMTGHSLGGNLAMSGAIEAPAAMQNRIDQVYSLDGPGVSQEYIDAHRDGIAKMADRITHYQWSLVGGMLNLPDGIANYYAEVDDGKEYGFGYNFTKHDSCFVRFDENGNIIISKHHDPLIDFARGLTEYLDRTTFGHGLWAVPELLVYGRLGRMFPIVRAVRNLHKTVVIFKAIKEKIKKAKKARSKYKNVDFIYNVGRMREVEERQLIIQEELYQIADELDVIRSRINSISLWSVKMSAATLVNRVEETAKKSKKLAKAIEKIDRKYDRNESNLVSSAETLRITHSFSF